MKTGVVFKIENHKAVIMLTGGKFISVNTKTGWQKGDVVCLKEPRFAMKTLYYATAACFIFMFFFGLGGYRLYFTQTSLISIDINPSVEIGLNRFDRVINVTNFNDDGANVLSSVNLRYKEYSEALDILMTSKELHPYLTVKGVRIIFAVESDNPNKCDLLSGVINEKIETLSTRYSYLKAECRVVSREFVDEAGAHGLTPGKYLMLLKLKEIKPEIDIDDYKNMAISKIVSIIEQANTEDYDGNRKDIENQGHPDTAGNPAIGSQPGPAGGGVIGQKSRGQDYSEGAITSPGYPGTPARSNNPGIISNNGNQGPPNEAVLKPDENFDHASDNASEASGGSDNGGLGNAGNTDSGKGNGGSGSTGNGGGASGSGNGTVNGGTGGGAGSSGGSVGTAGNGSGSSSSDSGNSSGGGSSNSGGGSANGGNASNKGNTGASGGTVSGGGSGTGGSTGNDGGIGSNASGSGSSGSTSNSNGGSGSSGGTSGSGGSSSNGAGSSSNGGATGSGGGSSSSGSGGSGSGGSGSGGGSSSSGGGSSSSGGASNGGGSSSGSAGSNSGSSGSGGGAGSSGGGSGGSSGGSSSGGAGSS